MSSKVFLAVDLGASSGRVLAGLFNGNVLELREVHRFPNAPVSVHDRMYWRSFDIWGNIIAGLQRAAREFGGNVVSVGVDAWGVDFGLLDRHGELLAAPITYRDSRTRGAMAQAFDVVPRERIFAATGLQFMEINTLYQLLAAKRMGSPPLDRAGRLLMMPDLYHWMLSGEQANELTISSTTQLFDPRAGNWSDELIQAFGLPREIFGPIRPPGTVLGRLLHSVADETGLRNVNVVLPGSHDTASAVMAVPAASVEESTRDRWCYISSGTWSLMGVEIASPLINPQAFRSNFTNEGGVGGTTRLLRNITGLWLLQECQRIWRTTGQNCDWPTLMRLAEQAPPFAAVFDPDEPSLVAPADMPRAIAACCGDATFPDNPGGVARSVLESLALKYRYVLRQLEELTAQPITEIHVVGGGSQNQLLCQLTADACNRPVFAGPVEATALGNVLMQAIAAGVLANVAEAREVVRASFEVVEYQPRPDDRWQEMAARLLELGGPTY